MCFSGGVRDAVQHLGHPDPGLRAARGVPEAAAEDICICYIYTYTYIYIYICIYIYIYIYIGRSR